MTYRINNPIRWVLGTGTSHTAQLDDAFAVRGYDSVDEVSVTIPPDADLLFEAGTELYIAQFGSAAVKFIEGAGVSFLTRGGTGPVTTAQDGPLVVARKVSADTWHVWGGGLDQVPGGAALYPATLWHDFGPNEWGDIGTPIPALGEIENSPTALGGSLFSQSAATQIDVVDFGNGLPALSPDDVNEFLRSTLASSSDRPFTVWIVGRANAVNNTGLWSNGETGGNSYSVRYLSGGLWFAVSENNNVGNVGPSLSEGDAFVVSIRGTTAGVRITVLAENSGIICYVDASVPTAAISANYTLGLVEGLSANWKNQICRYILNLEGVTNAQQDAQTLELANAWGFTVPPGVQLQFSLFDNGTITTGGSGELLTIDEDRTGAQWTASGSPQHTAAPSFNGNKSIATFSSTGQLISNTTFDKSARRRTLHFVFNRADTVADRYLFATSGFTIVLALSAFGTTNAGYYSPETGWVDLGVAIPLGLHVITFEESSDGTLMNLYVDGTFQASNTCPNLKDLDVTSYICNSSGANRAPNGDLCEVSMHESTTDGSDRDDEIARLEAKWGVV